MKATVRKRYSQTCEISPFDSNGKRHTSFATLLHIDPLIDDDIEINLNDSEIKIDTYRASGAGGQHVNKTDSAVRNYSFKNWNNSSISKSKKSVEK